jgi:hypothetical protein
MHTLDGTGGLKFPQADEISHREEQEEVTPCKLGGAS